MRAALRSAQAQNQNLANRLLAQKARMMTAFENTALNQG
jgi:hypothetical protein